MLFNFAAKNLSDLDDIAEIIINKTYPKKNFALYAEMGVGKTTLIKALSLQLGGKDLVNSPTFSIINEYLTFNEYKIYHFDFYRIENEKEAISIGCEDYFFSSDYCFIEWPEKIPALIDKEVVKIYITLDHHKRLIEVKF